MVGTKVLTFYEFVWKAKISTAKEAKTEGF